MNPCSPQIKKNRLETFKTILKHLCVQAGKTFFLPFTILITCKISNISCSTFDVVRPISTAIISHIRWHSFSQTLHFMARASLQSIYDTVSLSWDIVHLFAPLHHFVSRYLLSTIQLVIGAWRTFAEYKQRV